MLTPSQISVKPNVMSIIVPEYDFEGQNRWDGTLMAGEFTANSAQTFHPTTGMPEDANSDYND